MAIFGIGAYYEKDVSQKFIDQKIIGTGHSEIDGPDIHCFIKSLKVGDIVYIKSYPPAAEHITIKAIGVITDMFIISNKDVAIGRNVSWLSLEKFDILPPTGKNQVRYNTLYEEWHPSVQKVIIDRVLSRLVA